MKWVAYVSLVAAVVLLGHLRLTAADVARFRYLASVYADEKSGAIDHPEGVACGADGRLVVGDTGNDRLIRYTYLDKTFTDGRELKIPELSAPARVQLDSKGDIYALDGKRRRIVHLDREGAFKAVLSFNGAPAPATVVPKSFAIDADDTIYVLDVFSERVLVCGADGQFRRALALPDDIGFGTDVAIDSGGTLFVLDSVGRRLLAAGKDASTFSRVGEDLSPFLPTLPTSVTASKGLLFVAEGIGGSIVGFRRDASFATRQLTTGAEEGMLNHPAQMCVNERDEAFIADRDNSRIQVFQVIR